VESRVGRIALEAARPVAGNRAERIVFVEMGGDEQAEAEFAARTLDVWFPEDPPRRVEGSLSIPGTRVGLLVFQTEKEPFSRKKVRQAIATALDPSLIGVALERGAVPLQSFLPPGIWGRREGSPLLGANPAGAVNMGKVAESLASALGAAGGAVRPRVESPETVRALTQAGDYDIALVEAGVDGGDPHLFLYPLSTTEGAVRGPSATNLSFYRNRRLDDLLIRASQLAFRPERQRLYGRAQALMADELPWLPVYVRLRWAVVRPEIGGLRLHPTGFHRLDTLTVESPVFLAPR